jgi:hypothetical protein
METVNALIRDSPDSAFAVSVEAENEIRGKTVLSPKPVYMTAVNVIDALAYRSNP